MEIEGWEGDLIKMDLGKCWGKLYKTRSFFLIFSFSGNGIFIEDASSGESFVSFMGILTRSMGHFVLWEYMAIDL